MNRGTVLANIDPLSEKKDITGLRNLHRFVLLVVIRFFFFCTCKTVIILEMAFCAVNLFSVAARPKSQASIHRQHLFKDCCLKYAYADLH